MLSCITNSVFLERYRLIGSTDRPLIKRSIRVCRYCYLNETSTTFKNKAHLVSHFLGGGRLYYEECDSCNSLFSKMESHFSRYFGAYFSLIGLKGKKGVPMYQSRSNDETRSTRTQVYIDGNGQRHITMMHKNDLDIDRINKTATFQVRPGPIKPLYIYANIVKYGVSTMPYSKLQPYKSVTDWLLGKCDIHLMPIMFFYPIGHKIFQRSTIELYERIDNTCISDGKVNPRYTVLMYFGNIFLQSFLPNGDEKENKAIFKQTELANGLVINNDSLASYPNQYKHVPLSETKSINMDYEISLQFDAITSD